MRSIVDRYGIMGGLFVLMAVGAAGSMALIVQACTARETAKDAYSAQQHACLVAFTAPADQRECVDKVRARWTEAGSPPAAVVVDAGGQ